MPGALLPLQAIPEADGLHDFGSPGQSLQAPSDIGRLLPQHVLCSDEIQTHCDKACRPDEPGHTVSGDTIRISAWTREMKV